jgi:hypothetical protein
MQTTRLFGKYALLLACWCGGCMRTIELKQQYGGARKPAAEVARIWSSDRVVIREIDGRPQHKAGRWENAPSVLYEVEPGRHHIVAARVAPPPASGGIYNADFSVTAIFDFDFQAGKEYTFNATETFGGKGTAIGWKARLVDRQSGQTLAEPIAISGKPTTYPFGFMP